MEIVPPEFAPAMTMTAVGIERPPARRRWVLPTIMIATIASVFPGFLIGAIAVQASAEFAVTEAVYGWGLGGFFLAATVGSVGLGRLAQRIGPRRQILCCLVITSVVEGFIAGVATGWWWIVAALALAGLADAGTQTAVNPALTQARLPRLGLAIALKRRRCRPPRCWAAWRSRRSL